MHVVHFFQTLVFLSSLCSQQCRLGLASSSYVMSSILYQAKPVSYDTAATTASKIEEEEEHVRYR